MDESLLHSLMLGSVAGKNIDRQALVNRYNVNISEFDSLSALSVGYGEFAFTVGATGLQTFPVFYETGMPLGTQSQRGWHSFPKIGDYKMEDVVEYYPAEDGHGYDGRPDGRGDLTSTRPAFRITGNGISRGRVFAGCSKRAFRIQHGNVSAFEHIMRKPAWLFPRFGVQCAQEDLGLPGVATMKIIKKGSMKR